MLREVGADPGVVDEVAVARGEERPGLVHGREVIGTSEGASFERLADDALEPDAVLAMFRAVERDLQGLSAGTRPVLAVPHLLAGEASAYYHGYVMAEMAVHQTRAFFVARDGHLVDNPRVGPDLAAHYWAPGNAQTFNETLRSLTGSPLSADAIVASCNLGVDEAVAQARAAIARLPGIAPQQGPVDLDVTVRVVHGREVIGTSEGGSFERLADDFEAWIGRGS